MTTKNCCPECGRELSGDEIEGLCPACLLARGMLSMGDSTVASDAPLGELSDEDIAAIPETPGRYTILGEHAKGGMGRVLLVHDETLGRDVALKELLPEYVADDSSTPTPVRHSKEMAARFLREARITGQLEHPSITPVHELGRRPDGTLYYTMKLVKGRTLARAIKECKTLEERLKLLPRFVDLCNAIAYAHSRGVIHRDIKPQNVMVGDYGETVILDWGLAKAKSPKREGPVDQTAQTLAGIRPDSQKGIGGVKTHAGEIIGTPAYMSPEQARGEEADERSDVYSLGVILYEILTGRVPFTGATVSEILTKVRRSDFLPPHKLERRCGTHASKLCKRAMHHDPMQRPESAHELAGLITSRQFGPVYLNPFRPNLKDLVPEVRKLSRRESSRLRNKAWNRGIKDIPKKESLFASFALLIATVPFWLGLFGLLWSQSLFHEIQDREAYILALERRVEQATPGDFTTHHWSSGDFYFQSTLNPFNTRGFLETVAPFSVMVLLILTAFLMVFFALAFQFRIAVRFAEPHLRTAVRARLAKGEHRPK